MDFASIVKHAGLEAAQKICSDTYFNRCIAPGMTDLDPRHLEDLAKGSVILAVEPVKRPLTTAVCLYLRRKRSGDVIAVLLESTARGHKRPPLKLSTVTIQSGDKHGHGRNRGETRLQAGVEPQEPGQGQGKPGAVLEEKGRGAGSGTGSRTG